MSLPWVCSGIGYFGSYMEALGYGYSWVRVLDNATLWWSWGIVGYVGMSGYMYGIISKEIYQEI